MTVAPRPITRALKGVRANIRGIAAAFVAATVLAGPHTAAAENSAAPIAVRWTADARDPRRTVVEVTGLPASTLRALTEEGRSSRQWNGLLSAVAETGDLATDLELPALAGAYEVTPGILRFAPAFPLEAGIRYRATFRPAALPESALRQSSPVVATHRIPDRARVANTRVAAIYPSTSRIPENVLKFYLHFTAPMSRGHIYDHIHLRDADGHAVELPFLEIDEELWNPAMTRLTLFLDPGRIKRGVKPLEEIGPSLEVGRSYTLVIDRQWQDGAGAPLIDDFTKTFQVTAADREPPDPASWKITAPPAHGRDALRIAFPEPLDHALADRVFAVQRADGTAVAGVVTVGAEEREWTFIPREAWDAREYRVVVPTTLEDLAGNNIGKPFDVDLFERVERRVTEDRVSLRFAPK